jgi:hypothetical protein
VQKGWNLLGNPFSGALPMRNMSVKLKNGNVLSLEAARMGKYITGYAWSYEKLDGSYHFASASPERYKTSAFAQTYIAPFRGFWIYVFSDQVESIIMDS